MQNIPVILSRTVLGCAAALLLTVVTGCKSTGNEPAKPATAQPAPAVAATTPAPAPAVTAPTAAAGKVIRIKAGASAPVKDSAGNEWAAETGFEGGSTIDRDASTVIANTKDSALFLSEHYGMDSFSIPVPNGKYLAKLYFAETYEGVTGPGERVFNMNVQGKEFKNFDVFAKAGGANKAYIETVPVEVTDGKFKITFTAVAENPMINAIELIPQQ